MLEAWLSRTAWASATSLSLPARREPHGTEAYGLHGLRITPTRAGDWIGRRDQGASVNCDDVTLCAHSGVTHTECARHVGDLDLQIHEVAPLQLLRALLLDIAPTRRPDGASVISDASLQHAWASALGGLPADTTLDAIVVRSRPSDEPPHRVWSNTDPPYFEPDAISTLVARDVQHIITDLPSLDPEVDAGALICHRAFFGLSPSRPERQRRATITELAWVPASLSQGPGLLRLDVVEWPSDAAPSRPVFYPVRF